MKKSGREAIARQLRARGLKVTPQRLAIMETLAGKRDFHPTARSVYEEARKKRKSLSLSTTYANLNELSRLGVIKTLQFDSMENRYEGNLDEHLNLICEGCGRILDYGILPVVDQHEIARKTGFSVRESRLEYYGLCGECHAKAAEAGDRSGEEDNA